MKLESQVCSVEQAQRLKKLGIDQESAFWWNITPSGVTLEPERLRGGENVSAFTVAELGELLPAQLPSFQTLLIKKYAGIDYWCVGYGSLKPKMGSTYDHSDNLAASMAEILIYVVESEGMI